MNAANGKKLIDSLITVYYSGRITRQRTVSVSLQDKFVQTISEKIRATFGRNAEITSLAPLAGDASSRRYYRAALTGADAVSSVIVMEIPAGSALPLSSEELAVFKQPPRELPFLNLHRFLTSIGVRIPALYSGWEKEGILLLEDLGDTALWDRVQGLREAEVADWYRKAIDQLLVLQIRGTRERDESCIAFQQRFDFRLYMWEFDHFLEYGLQKRADVRVTPSAIEHLRKTFTGIAATLDRQEACLSHRDYHSWNLMIYNNEVVIIDFQDALLAPPQYDLASLLNDRITDSVVTPDLEERLVRYYVDGRVEQEGHGLDREQFREIYLLSAIQRDLKVVGRFYYLDLVKGKPGYKKFIPPTVHRLRRNLARLPQTAKIIPLLVDHFEEMQ
jgi:aminoglycoside/choline kinase family phosphotransferase